MFRDRKLFVDAEKWLRKAIDIDPKSATAHNDLALLYKDQKRFDDALAAFTTAVDLDPSEPLFPRNIGDMFRDRKLFVDAEKWLREAIDIDPKHAPAHNGLALLYQDKKRFDDALAAFTTAADLDPSEPLYPRNIGYLFREWRLFVDAEMVPQGHRHRPKTRPRTQRPRAPQPGSERFDDALAAFTTAADLDPSEPLYPRNIGDMFRDRKLFVDAEKWLRKAIDIDPKHAPAHNGLALLYQDQTLRRRPRCLHHRRRPRPLRATLPAQHRRHVPRAETL